MITDKDLFGLYEEQVISWARSQVLATLFLYSRLLIKGIKLGFALDCCLWVRCHLAITDLERHQA